MFDNKRFELIEDRLMILEKNQNSLFELLKRIEILPSEINDFKNLNAVVSSKTYFPTLFSLLQQRKNEIEMLKDYLKVEIQLTPPTIKLVKKQILKVTKNSV